MVTTHNLGYPRIGARRELKFALESYWKGECSRAELQATGAQLRRCHWQHQSGLDWVPVGDFSFYDQVLDMSLLLGNLPERVQQRGADPLDTRFRLARGRSVCRGGAGAHAAGGATDAVTAAEMTKWFNTNYHYIVPEFTANSRFALHAEELIAQLNEARQLGIASKPVLIGPLTYLALGKAKDGSDKLALLERLLPVYQELLSVLAARGVSWVQLDEPILCSELSANWQEGFRQAYRSLATPGIQILLTTYFGALGDNLALATALPVAGVHLDAINGREDVEAVLARLGPEQVLSLGVIDGRNIWATDLHALLAWLEPLAARLGERLWIAPSCSLLHVPVDLEREQALAADLRSWLAFARQKLAELRLLGRALNGGRASVQAELETNRACLLSRRQSRRVHDSAVEAALAALEGESSGDPGQRRSPYAVRAERQQQQRPLPLFPTTTIGSFPQTAEIRRARRDHRAGVLDQAGYEAAMRQAIKGCIRAQESLGLDVLVHGEAERNDMVEFFGEQLRGYAFSQAGWVQSYGSRCVKPPILYGDVSRPQAMTLAWTAYAQSLTDKPVKGMLTGPVTLLNWSFVRDDQPRARTCLQLALAIREEVRELERHGVGIIQIDEPALREGLPLRRSQWADTLAWAVRCFRIAANGVEDTTQIHTHMCYSEFNDIMPSIIALDADVISIETSRSDMELLEVFDHLHYPNAIGPGVYDIHSPNLPSQAQMVTLLRKAAARIPAERLWVNPDCGLKTRQWPEVLPALQTMVAAAHSLRAGFTACVALPGAGRG